MPKAPQIDLPAPYLDVAHAARRHQVSDRLIWQFIRAGYLPAYRFGPGRLVRIRVEDLDALLTPIDPADYVENRRAGVVA